MICVIKTSLKFEMLSTNCLGIFFAEADTKNRRYAMAKASAAEVNFENRALFNNQNSLVIAAESSILPVRKGFESKYVTLT